MFGILLQSSAAIRPASEAWPSSVASESSMSNSPLFICSTTSALLDDALVTCLIFAPGYLASKSEMLCLPIQPG